MMAKINKEILRQEYEKLSTEDLMKAVTINKLNYEAIAIETMKNELEKRNVSDMDIAKFEKEYSQESVAHKRGIKMPQQQLHVRYAKAFIMFLFLSILIAVIVTTVVGAIVYFIVAPGELNLKDIQIMGYVVSIVVTYIFYKWSISKYIIPQVITNQSMAENQRTHNQ